MQAARYLLFHPFFRTELAAALGTIGLFGEGVAEINETLRFAMETDYRWFVPETLRTEGELLALRGSEEPGLIEALFRRSINQASTQNALYWELSAATSLAALLRNQHRHGEALAVLSPLNDHFADGLSTPRLREAGHLLHQLRGKNGSESLRD
jgi:non-specific serine/threonine protein kinase